MQLNEGERGFSFLREGPLDMRMDPSLDLTAEEIVNKWSEQELAKIFFEYGEERQSRKIARAIVFERKKKRLRTTKELSDLIESLFGGRGKRHPATLVFQALRIAVNDELKSIEIALKEAIQFLATGGRLGVISFHRLEDRIAKETFKASAREGEVQWMTKKPIVPTLAEMKRNPRSRSAKLRVIEKI